MIEQLYFQELASLFQLLRQVNIALAGNEVARRVVVCDDDAAGQMVKGAFEYYFGISDSPTDTAFADTLLSDEPIGPVQEERPEFFAG